MKKLFLTLIITLLYTNAMALNSGTFAIEHHSTAEKISYKLPITQEFKESFVNALKTGQTVKIVHSVKIRPVDQWFGWLAEKNYTKYYKYNLINNQYFVGVRQNKLSPVASLDKIIADVTGLKKAPFLPKRVLQKDYAYELDFTISINPMQETTSSALLLFKGKGLKERLHSAVHYINK